jgi:hypothetical protein
MYVYMNSLLRSSINDVLGAIKAVVVEIYHFSGCTKQTNFRVVAQLAARTIPNRKAGSSISPG